MRDCPHFPDFSPVPRILGVGFLAGMISLGGMASARALDEMPVGADPANDGGPSALSAHAESAALNLPQISKTEWSKSMEPAVLQKWKSIRAVFSSRRTA